MPLLSVCFVGTAAAKVVRTVTVPPLLSTCTATMSAKAGAPSSPRLRSPDGSLTRTGPDEAATAPAPVPLRVLRVVFARPPLEENIMSSTGLTLGTAASAPLLVWMMAEMGWRQSFVLLGPIGFIGAFLWWWYVRDNPAEHPAVNEEEAAMIVANRPVAAPLEAGDERPGWQRVLKDRNVLLLTLSYFCMNYIFYLMFNWVFYYMVEVRGFEGQQAGYFTSIQWIAAAVGATLGGFLCDFLCRRIGLRFGRPRIGCSR